MSNRGEQWADFSTLTRGHIDTYTVAQYGDFPDDMVSDWTASECVAQIDKYVKRHQTMRRGRLETLRDLVKIAHYASLAFQKMKPQEEEIEKILEGKV